MSTIERKNENLSVQFTSPPKKHTPLDSDVTVPTEIVFHRSPFKTPTVHDIHEAEKEIHETGDSTGELLKTEDATPESIDLLKINRPHSELIRLDLDGDKIAVDRRMVISYKNQRNSSGRFRTGVIVDRELTEAVIIGKHEYKPHSEDEIRKRRGRFDSIHIFNKDISGFYVGIRYAVTILDRDQNSIELELKSTDRLDIMDLEPSVDPKKMLPIFRNLE